MMSNAKGMFKAKSDSSVGVIISVLSFIFLTKSPLHIWIGGVAFTDSSVFKTVAMMMKKGYIPYKDSFDHKGPVIYIINFLGNQISAYRGVWIIEMLVLTVTFYAIYKIARLSCGLNSSLMVLLLSVSLLFGYYEGGNLTEEYAMPCIAVSLYIFLDYVKNNRITKIRLLIAGSSCGIVLFLRANMISTWAIFCIAIMLFLLTERQFDTLRQYIIWFGLGMMVIILPILVWLTMNGALGEFWNDYVIFNNKYISSDGVAVSFENKWLTFFYFMNTTIFLISFGYLVLKCINDKHRLDIVYLIYLIVTLIWISLSGIEYDHYGMILIPAVSYPLSLFFSDLHRIQDNNTRKSILAIMYLIVMIYTLPQWIDLIKYIPQIYVNRNEEHKDSSVRAVVDIIDNYTNEEESISVYGNWDIIYVLSQRKHATKYSYQFPIGQVMPEIMDEYMEQLNEEQPTIIVVQTQYKDDAIEYFLTINHYELLGTESAGQIFCKDKN